MDGGENEPHRPDKGRRRGAIGRRVGARLCSLHSLFLLHAWAACGRLRASTIQDLSTELIGSEIYSCVCGQRPDEIRRQGFSVAPYPREDHLIVVGSG